MRFRGSVLAVLLVALAVVLCVPAESASARPDPGLVATDAGLVRGVVTGELGRFQGIPFARPPVADLRWRAPQRVQPWDGVYDATAPRSQCAQLAPPYGGTTTDDEDCLYLNVTTPARTRTAARRLPVMVWLHGGSNVTGSGEIYDAAKLATEGNVVVVTVNYRLGVFGWLAHPAFETEDPGLQAGNYGLLDQQAALRWVHRNAAAFGGDPRNVTLFGESAGAQDTCANLASPAAAGLFHKAIMQSYSCAAPVRTEDAAQAAATDLAGAAGCADAACLRAVPARTLLDEFEAAGADAGPVAGGDDLLPRQPADAIAANRFNRMPVMHGNTLDEMRLFVGLAFPAEITAEQYRSIITASYGDRAPAVLARYPVERYATPRIALATVQTDFGTPISTCQHLAAYRLLAAARVPVYAYQFADRAAPPLVDLPDYAEGAEHATELTFLWPGLLGSLTEPQQRLSTAMVAYWTSFAHKGKPHATHAPHWGRFGSADDVLSLAPGPHGIRTVDIEQASNCAFWS